MDTIYKEYQPTKDLKIVIESPDQGAGASIIKLQHTPTPSNMPGEIILAPSQLPDIIKALTSAALDATFRDTYLLGHGDGCDAIAPELHKALDKYYATEEGKKAWPKVQAELKRKKENG